MSRLTTHFAAQNPSAILFIYLWFL